MNKKLLTISALCTLGTAGTFAQSSFDTEYTVMDQYGSFNYKYKESDIIGVNEGKESDDPDNDASINNALSEYKCVANIRDVKTIYEQVSIVNLTLKGCGNTFFTKPSITSWSQNPPSTVTNKSIFINTDDFVTSNEDELKVEVDTDSPEYKEYEEACDILVNKFSTSQIVKGTYGKISPEDIDGYEINPHLYYMVKTSGRTKKDYVPVLALEFKYVSGYKYENSTTTFVPTYFEDAALADYTDDLKGLKVEGAADNYFTTVTEADGGIFLYNGGKELLYTTVNLKDGGTYILPFEIQYISDQALANMRNVTLISPYYNVIVNGELGGENNRLITPNEELEITNVNGKLGKVTGIVNAQNLASFDPGDYLNIDFTEASIVGDELYPEVPTNKLYYFSKEAAGKVSGTNVVIDGECESYELYDTQDGDPVLTEVYVWQEFEAKSAIYYRTFKTGSYATLTMPFTGNANTYLSTTALTGYDESKQKFQFTKETMAANKPYLVYVDAATSRIRATRAIVSETTPVSNSTSNAAFKGTYETLYAKNGNLNTTNDFLFTSTGVLNFVGANAGLRPCRAYMTLQNPPVKPESITLELLEEDGSTFTVATVDSETGIEGLVSGDMADNTNVISTKYFDVTGARLDAPAKGITIVREQLANGKTRTTKKAF